MESTDSVGHSAKSALAYPVVVMIERMPEGSPLRSTAVRWIALLTRTSTREGNRP